MGNCNENNQIKHKNKLDSINTNNKSSKIIVGSDFVIEGMGDAFSLCDNKKNIILTDLKDLYPEKTEKKYHNVDKMRSIGVLNEEKELCDKIIEYKKKIGADYDDWELKKDSVKDKIDTVTSFIQDGVWDFDTYKKNIMEQYKWEVKLLLFVEKDPSLNEQQKKVLKDRVNKRKQIIDTEKIPEDEEEPKTFTKKLNDTSQNKNSPNISDINRYITKINELEKKLNEEKEKNQIIINENNNLTKKINELKIELNQIEDLKQTINKLNIELNQLKESNLKLENYIRQNNINILNISSQQNNKDVYYDLNSLNLNPNDKIISVNFVSMGNNDIGHYSLVCKYKDLFVKLEERLYNDFQQFTNYETYFEANGRRVKRFKTLEQNNIKNNDIINIFIIEE